MILSLRSAALTAASVATLLATSVSAIPRITRTGRYLYQEDGTRFYIRGIAYQEQGEVVWTPDNHFGEPSTFIDPLAQPEACARDVVRFREANVNTIRVYSVDSSLDHDACMQTFSDAGIYTIIDLSLPLNGSIIRAAPAWSSNMMNQYLKTIDVFSKYDNVLAYNVGNEVAEQGNTALSSYIKASARDVKAYIKSRNLNNLVAYSAINGESTWRNALANYLSCGSEETAIDIYGLNDYSWCGDSSFESSYAGVTRQLADYNVVAYLSEFGSDRCPPRLFTEATAIFSSQMSDVWSGGIAFSYFFASGGGDGFGMVEVSGTTVTPNADWTRFVAQYNAIDAPNSPAQDTVAASTYPACAEPVPGVFEASNTLPPTPNEEGCTCLEQALSCRYSATISDYSELVGELIDSGCDQLGAVGGSCDPIGGEPSTGVYGHVAACDPRIKLSWIMSQYYEATDRNPASCDFGGNAQVNPAASATGTADEAVSQCIPSPSATFTPTLALSGPTSPATPPPTNGGDTGSNSGGNTGGNAGGSTGGSNSDNNNGAVPSGALAGVLGVTAAGVLCAVWALV